MRRRGRQAHPSSPIAQGGGFRKTEDQTTTHPIPSRRLSDRSPAATPSWEPGPRAHDPFPEPGNSCGGALAMGEWFESRDGESGGGGGLHRQSYGMQHAKGAASPRTRTLVPGSRMQVGWRDWAFYGSLGGTEGVWSTARRLWHPRTRR